MSNESILFADDDRVMVESLSRWFNRMGYRTTPTYDGMQCLMAAAKNQYDAAVIDIGLPEMDGFELLSKLVQLNLFPVIVLSGYYDPKFEAEAMRRGASRFIVKPAPMIEVEEAIQQAIARYAFSNHQQFVKN